VLQCLNITNRSLDNVRHATKNDVKMQSLKQTIIEGWPNTRSECDKKVLDFFNHRDELSESDGLIFRGQKIVIPESLRQHMIEQVHIGHMGTEKSLQRAKDVMFWPGMAKHITDYVLNCTVCMTHRHSNQKEPMTPHEVPQRPWQDVGTDIFHLDGQDYLITVDYYSKYFEIDRLPDTRSTTVVRKLKANFARHGIPDKVVSDNGPQYSSETFQTFAKDWKFDHVTSSPHYPISNGLAEKTVQTAKRLLQKAKESGHDPYLCILEYRNTPLSDCKFSPVQLLMGRRTKSILPTTIKQLIPTTVHPKSVRPQMLSAKQKQKYYYDKSAKPHPKLQQNENVRIQSGKTWKPAKVISVHDDHSYVVQTPDGAIYRRNRRHLNKTNETFPNITNFSPNIVEDNPSKVTDSQIIPNEPQVTSEQPPKSTDIPYQESTLYKTRSGRIVQPSSRYNSRDWLK
jgi:transposase InsO family protein